MIKYCSSYNTIIVYEFNSLINHYQRKKAADDLNAQNEKSVAEQEATIKEKETQLKKVATSVEVDDGEFR